MSYQNARIIVLGATGFIGRWVARKIPFDAKSYLVIRDNAVAPVLMSTYNIKGTIVPLDVTDFSQLKRLFAEIRPSIVFNLAGYGVDPLERNADLAEQINVRLPRVICDFLKVHHDSEWNGQQLIHAGSALEYGIARGVLSEQVKPQPTTQYGISKLAGTSAVLESPLRTIVARLFNVYGPGEPGGRLLPSLIEAAKTQKDLALTPGTQKRDFTYVEDIAEGFLRLGLVTERSKLPVNLSTGRLHSVRQFAEIAAQILGISANRLHFGELPFRQEEMDHEGVSTDCLSSLIKWTPSITIENGVRKTLEFLEARHE